MHLATVPAEGGAVTRLIDGRRVIWTYDAAPDGRLVARAATATTTPELFAVEKGALRALTHVNDSLLAQLALGTTEDVDFKNKDGLTVGALLVKPAGFQAGKKYPLLLWIHGGPNGQDQHAFAFQRELYAANGYLVLAVNYRGSSGRGQAWKKAIFADWGNKGGAGPPGRRRPCHLVRDRRSGAPGHRRLELRRDPDRLHHRHHHALQGGEQWGGECTADDDVRYRPVHLSVRERTRRSVEEPEAVGEALVSLLQGRPDQDADAARDGARGAASGRMLRSLPGSRARTPRRLTTSARTCRWRPGRRPPSSPRPPVPSRSSGPTGPAWS
ncbi:MAG: prolyl oligopeptidase family serine peptidase [Gemmatimonadetes bacterium]|nr:prolyl oligopeptidase family serine peptidase [Gemmatimonadota bacterium]